MKSTTAVTTAISPTGCLPSVATAAITSNATTTSPQPFSRKHLTTDEAAEMLCVQPQTLRKAYSQRGAYGNVKPTKCVFNRRLYWDADAVRRLMEGA